MRQVAAIKRLKTMENYEIVCPEKRLWPFTGGILDRWSLMGGVCLKGVLAHTGLTVIM